MRDQAKSEQNVGGNKTARENEAAGNAEYTGLVKNEILAQMFQKALTLRAELATHNDAENSVEGSLNEARMEKRPSEGVISRRRSTVSLELVRKSSRISLVMDSKAASTTR